MFVKSDENASWTMCYNKGQNERNSTSWCLDSRATYHKCNDEKLFNEIHRETNCFVKLSVDKTTEVTGKGSVSITVQNAKHTRIILLKNVLCVPELKCNLISTSKATMNNRSFISSEKE
ncbi:hypothetical protein NPIL_186241 [Nephila pilipes]|uniref:Retrovirus-related Pol polyprotein from transposon TNT 1-94-like beta-barrel domain-containing protein n=1 Tax=Nephila pilipes TaxID=299642 RepID=A0A8X6MNJ5_NEPPI|nr:hypothetical protein NPIL_186241 [Nephila pilipes]